MSEWKDPADAPKDEMVLCYRDTDFESINGLRLEAGASPGYSIDYGWRRGVTKWMDLPKA